MIVIFWSATDLAMKNQILEKKNKQLVDIDRRWTVDIWLADDAADAGLQDVTTTPPPFPIQWSSLISQGPSRFTRTEGIVG